MEAGVSDITDLGRDAWARARAAAADGRVIELGRVFHTGMPHYPTHPDFEVSLFRRHGERVRGDGASSASCLWTFGGHTGTHVDALCHVSQDGRMFDGAAVDNARLARGEAAGDAAALAPCIARGLLLDIAAFAGLDTLPPDYVIGRQVLQGAAARQGIRPAPGDVVLIRTGWGRYWGEPRYIGHDTPGPDLDGATWLADAGVAQVGSDTAVFEKGPLTEAAPVHRLLLIERQIPIMENLDLEPLAASGRQSFLFLSLPLRVRGATASPLRPVAVC
jgi:kynurenine formamidase